MKRNKQNNAQNGGYPQPNEYAPNAYQAGAGYQGYQAPQGYNQLQGYSSQQPGYNQQQGYMQPQGYAPNPGYQQPQGYGQASGYTASRSYQTPQVTASQQAFGSQNASASYPQQASFPQSGYQQQGYTQNPGGYPSAPYTQPNGYQQPGAYQQPNAYQQPTGANGFVYPGGQPSGESQIPRTPYDQGFTSPGGYQPAGYAQGYNAYNQMGRSPQMPTGSQPEINGQVPLNGGGYVPQPVPVRKTPFVLTDIYLLIISAALLCLFALGMWSGIGALKWVFLILAVGMTALLWIKPMTDKNKRLCFTIVFAVLALVTVIRVVTEIQGPGQTDQTKTPATATASASGQADPGQNSVPAALEVSPSPSVTNTPEPNADYEVLERLRTFFDYWALNRQEDMLTLCSPTWASKEENPKNALFILLRNRTPKNYKEENISGTSNDLSRTVTIVSEMDRNNGKDPVKYRMNIMMDKEADGLWYVNPTSLLSYDDADTPDPSVTDTPAPTATPAVNGNTPLYYNPSGGEYYHLDQNCKRIAEKFLPLQGKFTYAELNNDKYKKLKPCAICGAPYRE